MQWNIKHKIVPVHCTVCDSWVLRWPEGVNPTLLATTCWSEPTWFTTYARKCASVTWACSRRNHHITFTCCYVTICKKCALPTFFQNILPPTVNCLLSGVVGPGWTWQNLYINRMSLLVLSLVINTGPTSIVCGLKRQWVKIKRRYFIDMFIFCSLRPWPCPWIIG